MKRLFTILLALIIAAISCVGVCAVDTADIAARWDSLTSGESAIALTPGADNSEMRFCWESSLSDLAPDFIMGTRADLEDAIHFEVNRDIALFAFSNRVTVTQLDEGCTYYYSYKENGVWSATESFTACGSEFSAMFVSDSQIGRSGDWWDDDVLKHDTAGWYNTLETAADNNDIDLILSAGDQVEMAFSAKEYNLLLSAPVLKHIPLAPTIGNHDFYWPLYSQRFNLPNEYKNELLASPAGNSYYFLKGNALFIVLNSNHHSTLSHEALIREAVDAYPDAVWRVVMLHHSAYDAHGGINEYVSERLAPIFQSCGVDLVLSGHEHRYSRTYPMLNGAAASDSEGVVYLEGGSCSGSNGKGTTEGRAAAYIAGCTASSEPVYTMLDFTNSEITVRTYLAYDEQNVFVERAVITQFDGTNESTALSSPSAQTIFRVFSSFITFTLDKIFA